VLVLSSGTQGPPASRVRTGNIPFHALFTGFFGGDGLDDQGVTVIEQVQPAPSTEPKPAENRIYVPPHWVDGGYGVQVLQPSYWTVPKQAAEH